ncbi:MAG: phenylalanine--tRNA ligase subunit beta [Deltaproteobacteria bacterium]|nr:phenylalanine--tRNA ligase subunit beta [Deltaproteobacteria bacterium]
MKVPLSWLRDYVDINVSPQDLADSLTMAGLEVEEVLRLDKNLDTVVVGLVTSCRRHPQADKLSLLTVDTGKDILPIVCGAPNVAEGQLVALALEGTLMPGGRAITAAVIRGRESRGMVCSEAELNIGDDHSGIMILPTGLTLGTPVIEALGRTDYLYEIGITPNRADCLSLIGVAREAAAILGQKLRPGPDIAGLTSVTILDDVKCPRYAARLVQGVTIGPSPAWMRRRLEAAGVRAINNVVDVTNFVMLEYGQPLHAFDYHRLEEGRIVVRTAGSDETFTTLDGTARPMQEDMLFICDGRKPVALAGIMGGLNSEIKNDTSDVLIESAYFNPSNIRQTSKKLGLSTEASFRFERGVDPVGLISALDRSAQLIARLSGGKICRDRCDCHPRPVTRPSIRFELPLAQRFLGLEISPDMATAMLSSIEIPVTAEGNGAYTVTPPPFRGDLSIPEDIYEELVRLNNGFNRVPITSPLSRAVSRKPLPHLVMAARAKDVLAGIGFTEVINYSFISPNLIGALDLDSRDDRFNFVKVLNPLSEDQSVMRTSLLPMLLVNARQNGYHRNHDLALFETGKVFYRREDNALPREVTMLSGLITGRRAEEAWYADVSPVDLYDLKGALEAFCDGMNLGRVDISQPAQAAFLQSGEAAEIRFHDQPVGIMGRLAGPVTAAFDLRAPAYVFDLDFDRLLACAGQAFTYRSLPRYPSVVRDLALAVSEATAAGRIIQIIRGLQIDLIEDIILFDLYRGKHLAEGEKGLGFRIVYRSVERTLEDAEVNRLHEQVIAAVSAQAGARPR